MKPHSACRALLCGATLLAATAMAAPEPALPAAAVSPCLGTQASTAQQPQPGAQPRARWHGPCYLADAEKDEEPSLNDGAPPKTTQQRLDEIALLGRLGQPAEDSHQLRWDDIAPHGSGAGGPYPAQGGPGSWALPANPMYHAADSGAHIEANIPAVPEPGSLATWAAGLALLAGLAARRRRGA